MFLTVFCFIGIDFTATLVPLSSKLSESISRSARRAASILREVKLDRAVIEIESMNYIEDVVCHELDSPLLVRPFIEMVIDILDKEGHLPV